jgi:hypothetical protein
MLIERDGSSYKQLQRIGTCRHDYFKPLAAVCGNSCFHIRHMPGLHALLCLPLHCTAEPPGWPQGPARHHAGQAWCSMG